MSFDIQRWVANIYDEVAANLPPGRDDGEVSRAMAVQRFFIFNEDDISEAERRAWLDPDLVIEMAPKQVEDFDLPEWDARAWWAVNFDAAKRRKDAEEVRRKVRMFYSEACCRECNSPVAFAGSTRTRYYCPKCHPQDLAEVEQRAA